MLRFWAQDEQGDELFSDTREYGFNFVDPEGYEPAMVDNVSGRGFEVVLEAETTRRESFRFPRPRTRRRIKLHATLTYIFFAPPPPEAQNRMQQGIIARIQAAKTEQERAQILNEEIPARMRSMNVLATTYPPVVMASARKVLEVGAP
ncbi:hypothetical protein HRbin10_00695 [bacterium HR10]|nr:hypothetical protein HRbin10_00695 [bacterium HR10]